MGLAYNRRMDPSQEEAVVMEQFCLWIPSPSLLKVKARFWGLKKGCVLSQLAMVGTQVGRRESVKFRDLHCLLSKVSSESLHPGQRSTARISQRFSFTMSLGAGLQVLHAEGAGWRCCYSDPFAPKGLVSQVLGSQITASWPRSWKSHPSLTPLPLPHSPSLYLTVILSIMRWLCTWTTSVQQPGRKQTNEQNLHNFMPH